MSTSRVPATIDAIVNVLTVAGINTIDGPFVTGDYDNAVFVGYDGNPEGNFLSAGIKQEWSGTLGTARRDEIMEITCAVVVMSGDTDVKTARLNAFGLFGTVETTLRADPSLGFSSPYVAGVKPVDFYVEPDSERGFVARLVFVVEAKTRI